MEQFTITQDIEVVFIKAPKFPEEVPATFEKLNALLPENPNRKYFGISHPDQTGNIQYKAAAEVLEADHLEFDNLQKFIIHKGEFIGQYLNNNLKDSSAIGNAFQNLLKHPTLDPNGYCLEVYKNYTDIDVHCLVRVIH